MKTINLKNTQQLSRSEMREIIAGVNETATVLCNNGEYVTISSCKEMDSACTGDRNGAKICSGGGNNPQFTE